MSEECAKLLRKGTVLGVVLLLTAGLCVNRVFCWSNAGYSDDPASPKYGTHDWIAEHALDWLPQVEKQFIIDNLQAYLYGTELPGNKESSDHIGDTTKHHIYYFANGSVQDDSSADRAQKMYDEATNFYAVHDAAGTSKILGAMTHYIADVAVFAHVMNNKTCWGEAKHHDDYERDANESTNSYEAEFNSYLAFDGVLGNISAYDAALMVANDTTFDGAEDHTCLWMEQNYDWSNSTIRDRCGESLNLAVNLIADVLHKFYAEIVVPEFPTMMVVPAFVILTILAVVQARKKLQMKRRIPHNTGAP